MAAPGSKGVAQDRRPGHRLADCQEWGEITDSTAWIGFDSGSVALLDAGFGHRSAATETGAGAFNLAVGEASWGRLVPGLGAEVKHEIALDAGTITATARAAWQHSLLGAPSQTMAFAGTNADFSVQGASAAADRLNLGLGLKFQTDTNFTLSADYAGSLSKNSNQHSVRLAGMGQF